MNRLQRGTIVFVVIFAITAAIAARGARGHAELSAQPSPPAPIPAAPNSLPPERDICRGDFTVTNDSPPGSAPLTTLIATDRATYPIGMPVTFTVTVANSADDAVSVTLQRARWLYTLTVTDESGRVVWEWPTAAVAIGGVCTFGPRQVFMESLLWSQQPFPDTGRPAVPPGRYTVTARIVGAADTARASFTISAATSTPTPTATASQGQAVQLVAGCTNVTLTWPAGTPTERIAAAVTPPSALIAIWRLTNATGVFAGYTPRFPAASDLTAVSRLDAAFLCMDAPGSLTRPMI